MKSGYFNERRKKRREKFFSILGGKCSNCGSSKDLHFDHVNPKDKNFAISKKIDAPEPIILEELKGCQLLCGKCHKQKTLEKEEFGKSSEHGTIWRYKKYKCRCDKCRMAMSDYNKSQRRKALAGMIS